MKKIRTLVALLTVTLLLSGCVKCNFKMDIKPRNTVIKY